MAIIQTSIKLTDGMTPALQSMNKALNIVLNSFEAMQSASSSAIDTKSIQTARNELAKAQSQFNDIENEIRQNTNAQNQFNNSLSKGAGSANALFGKIKGIVGAYVGFQSAKGIMGLSDELTSTTARLNMMNDGLQTTAQLENKIYESAMRSRAGFMETADVVAKLGMRAGDIFKSNDETIAFAETLNKMFVVAGASQAEMSSATLQLTQALGAGVLRGEEFNAVFEAAPNIMQAVADYMKVPIGSLKEMASEGKISAQTVKNAMFNATDEVNKQFQSMPVTWAQAWTMFKNYAIKVFRPLLTTIGKITSSDRFIRFANGVANAMGLVAQVLGGVFDLALKVVDVFTDNWSLISPVIWGIITAMTIYKGVVIALSIAQAIGTAIETVSAFAKKVHSASSAMAAGATFKQTVAQYGLNAALLACPLTWIILGIIAVIAVIYLAVAAINKFAGTSYSATGFIAGLFMALGATLYNVVAYMWNTFASYAEFLVNVFQHPTYSIKKLFVNLATNVLDLCISMTKGWDDMATNFVNAIIDAVNGALKAWNWFVDKIGVVGEKLGLGKATMFEHKTSITSDLQNYKAGLQSLVADKPADYWEAPKMEMKDVGASYMKGYEWGDSLSDKISGVISGEKFGVDGLGDITNGGSNNLNDFGKALSGGYGNNPALDNIAKNTGDIADNTSSLAMSEKDLSYMRDLAEQEAINRYTLTDLKVEMTNNNNINSNMDLDKVVDYLQEKVYEGVLSTAEGVHF